MHHAVDGLLGEAVKIAEVLLRHAPVNVQPVKRHQRDVIQAEVFRPPAVQRVRLAPYRIEVMLLFPKIWLHNIPPTSLLPDYYSILGHGLSRGVFGDFPFKQCIVSLYKRA